MAYDTRKAVRSASDLKHPVTRFHGLAATLLAGVLLNALVGCGSEPISAVSVQEAVSLLDLFSQARKKAEGTEDWQTFIQVIEANIEGESERVLFLHPTSEIAFPLRIEQPAVLETAVALVPEAWEKQSDGVTFYVAIRKESEVLPTYVFKHYLSPELNQEFPGWQPVRIDLTPYRGTNIELIFSTDPGPNGSPLYDWAVWKDPRIYNPAREDHVSR